MKLTKKDLDMLNTASFYSKAQHRAVCEQAVKECYEYKCIEEELGIDLITLFKALKNGIYTNSYRSDGIIHVDVAGIGSDDLICISPYCTYEDCYEVELYADYGKTWALTREELK